MSRIDFCDFLYIYIYIFFIAKITAPKVDAEFLGKLEVLRTGSLDWKHFNSDRFVESGYWARPEIDRGVPGEYNILLD